MKIVIGTFDVEIKARDRSRYAEEYNELDTESLLNEISIWANQSAEVDNNSPFFGVRARQAGMDIYDFLRERGYYGSTINGCSLTSKSI